MGERAARPIGIRGRHPLGPPAFDGLPPVVPAGPRTHRGSADESAAGTHDRQEWRGDGLWPVRGHPGRDDRSQGGHVGAELGPGRRAACPDGGRDALLQVAHPRREVAVHRRPSPVALQLGDELSAQRRGQGCAHRCLDHRDVVPREQEQRAAHRHPAHQGPPPVHRVRDIAQGRAGAACEHREVDRRRVGGVERQHGTHDRLGCVGVAGEVMASHDQAPTPLDRHRSHPQTFPRPTPTARYARRLGPPP